MTKQEIIDTLSSQSNPSRLKRLTKLGFEGEALGVNLGPIRKYAKEIGINHSLGKELWDTRILEAQLLSCMILDSKQIQSEEALQMIQSIQFTELLDDVMFRCLVNIMDIAKLEATLKTNMQGIQVRAYWCIQVSKVQNKTLEISQLEAHLNQANHELQTADSIMQWMMNRFVAEVGIHYPLYRQECLNMGETLGVYKDMKVSKGCTSAYIPAWIGAVVKES